MDFCQAYGSGKKAKTVYERKASLKEFYGMWALMLNYKIWLLETKQVILLSFLGLPGKGW